MTERREVRRLSMKDQYDVTNHIQKWWDEWVKCKLTAATIAERCAEDLKIPHVTKSHIMKIVKDVLGKDFGHVEAGGLAVRMKLKDIQLLKETVEGHEETIIKLRSEVAHLTRMLEEHLTAPTGQQPRYRMENGRAVLVK